MFKLWIIPSWEELSSRENSVVIYMGMWSLCMVYMGLYKAIFFGLKGSKEMYHL